MFVMHGREFDPAVVCNRKKTKTKGTTNPRDTGKTDVFTAYRELNSIPRDEVAIVLIPARGR